MTVFSQAVALPWAREASINAQATWTPIAACGMARAGDGLAIAIWGEQVDRQAANMPVGWNYRSPLMHLGGVRYTETGPEVGATAVTLPSDPAARTGLFFDAIFSVGDETWALFTYNDAITPANCQYRMAKLSLNPSTLEVSIQWRWSLPKSGLSYERAHLDVWPEQRRVVIATTMGGTADGKPSNVVYLVDLDLGTLIAWTALPLASTSATTPYGISIDSQLGQVMLFGDRIVGGRDRSAFWTAPITASTLGAWTYRTHLPAPSSTTDYYPEKVAFLPRGGRWEYAGSQYPIWTALKHGFYTYPTTVAEDAASLSANFSGWVTGLASSVCITRDESLNRTAVGFCTRTDRTPQSEGTYGGVYHVELDESVVTDTLPLPGAEFAAIAGAIACVNFGDGRFLYLLGAAGVNKAYVSNFASYGFNVWAAGPTQIQPLPPGIKGDAPYESKSYFRRVN
jgi:hypothetical protein